ncbi:MAG: protein kinase [Chloroflexi bacterium]|nr:protein kinase [Chloroflexota bacterium]
MHRIVSAKHPGLSLAAKELPLVTLFRPGERRATEAALLAAARTWEPVQHLGLPKLVDVFAEGSSVFVVTELVDGWSLRNVIAQRLLVTPELARNWGAQLCQALAYLHELDPARHAPYLAPHHIMVTPSGTVKLVDWGLSALLSPSSYGPHGSIRGYMAPELRSGAPSPASDVFALARTLYAVLTGQLLEKGVQQPLPLRRAVPGIPPELARVIAQAADRDPLARPTVQALAEVLAPEGLPVSPIANWMQAAPAQPVRAADQAARQPAPTPRQPRTAADEAGSMADLGFVRDARFGANAAERLSSTPVVASTVVQKTRLSAQPRSFTLESTPAGPSQRLVVTVRNTGEAEATVRLVSHVDWIRAPQKSARMTPGAQAKFVLTMLPTEAPAGGMVTEPSALSVDTPTERVWIGVTVKAPAGPALSVEQEQLDFGEFEGSVERTLPLVLRNAGWQPLTVTVHSNVRWLKVPSAPLRYAPDQTVPVAVQLVADVLPAGEQVVPDALLIESDAGQQRVSARAWRKSPVLDLGARNLGFGAVRSGELAERLVYAGNTGDGLLEGQVRSLIPWLQVQPARFTCAPGDSVELVVRLDSVGLADGPLDVPQAVRLQTNAGSLTLPLQATIQAPRLTLDSADLDFGTVPLGEERELDLLVRNDGSAALEATAVSLLPWLELTDHEIACASGARCALRARANTRTVGHGAVLSSPAGVRLTAGATIIDVPVHIVVIQPALRVEPEGIDFGYIDRGAAESRSLTISNDGNGSLAWNATTGAAWVELSPSSGICRQGETRTVTVTAYGLALDAETPSATASLVINSDGGRAKVEMTIGIAAPQLDVDTALLELGPSINGASVSGTLRLFNRGLGMLTGTLSIDRPWLVPAQLSFECPTGRLVSLGLSTDMDEYPGGASRDVATVRLSSNGGAAEVSVGLDVVAAPEISVSEADVVLEQSATGAPAEGQFVIRNTGLATAHVTLVSSSRALRPSREAYDIKPGKNVKVRVYYEASGIAEAERADLLVAVTSESQALTVRVLRPVAR